MNRVVTTCVLGLAGVLVFAVSVQAASAIAACNGDMSAMPLPPTLWLVSGALFFLAALGRRANGR